MKKINHPPLYLVTKEEILNYIQTYGQKNGAKLPPEKELTKKLDISRGTLRKAMRLLEEGGFIRRKQGIGTIICRNKYIINSTHDINEGVSEMIQGKGMIPGSLNATIKEIRASKKLAEQLDLDIGNPVASLARIRTADGIPVTYTEDYLPQHLIYHKKQFHRNPNWLNLCLP